MARGRPLGSSPNSILFIGDDLLNRLLQPRSPAGVFTTALLPLLPIVLHPGIGINGITEGTHPKLEVGVPPVKEALSGDERSMVPLGTVLQALEVCVGSDPQAMTA